MSLLDKALAALGLQRMETTEEREALNMLAYCTTSYGDYLHGIRQAVDIAKAGGITDEKLDALLALGTWEMMTPDTERALRKAGIDTRPSDVVEAERRAGRS